MTAVRAELGKFLALAGYRFNRGESAPQMFSAAIDAEWHELVDSPEYAAFSIEHAGAVAAHVEGRGEGYVTWVSAYEEAYGPLPELWFTDADGQVDKTALAAYRETGKVWASWNCGPDFTAGSGSDTE
ncbi:hypothetical protein OG472_01685 [Streptomyces sp. NBC_00207]